MKVLIFIVFSAILLNCVSSGWVQLDRQLKQLDVDGTMICGTDVNNGLWCRANNTVPWVLLEGKFKHVAVNNGKFYAIDEYDQIFYKSSY